jgi:uroporphyrinogen-III decarboxylase
MFEVQTQIALQNLARIHEAVGERVSVAFVTGTDFGAQQGPLISPRTYRELFKPFHAQLNDWIHQHTTWKTFIHSCGSIWRLLDDIVDAGFDIVNPLQTSAAEMDPEAIKARYGNRLTLWGGGIDTQRVLPFGTPAEIRSMVRDRMRLFGRGGGFVFNTIHNVQAGIPVENILALYEAVGAYRTYPLL